MDKETWHMYTMEHHSAVKEQNSAICSNMHMSREYHMDVSQKNKGYHLYVESKI